MRIIFIFLRLISESENIGDTVIARSLDVELFFETQKTGRVKDNSEKVREGCLEDANPYSS